MLFERGVAARLLARAIAVSCVVALLHRSLRCAPACVRACVHACVRACVRACVHACVRACRWVNGARLDSATGKGVAGLEAEDVKLNGLIDDLEAEDVAMDGRVSTVEDFLSAMSPATGNVNQGTQSQLNTTGADYMTVSGGSLNVAETRCGPTRVVSVRSLVRNS